MKYSIRQTTRFKKNLKKILKRGKEYAKLKTVVTLLAQGKTLPPKYKDHALTGDLQGTRDCHIENDWVLLYTRQDDILVLTLVRTGTHSDLGL